MLQVVLTALLLLFAAGLMPITAAPLPPPSPLKVKERQFLSAHNNARAEHSREALDPLKWSRKLATYARVMVGDVQVHGHNPNTCTLPSSRFTSYAYNFVVDPPVDSPPAIVKTWLKRRFSSVKMMSKSTKKLGCGWGQCGPKVLYICLYNA